MFLPVVYVDFLSMYTTVNALMGSWWLIIARKITVTDTTAKVTKLLHSPKLLERCFQQRFWPTLLCLVLIEPDGDAVPVRAAYDPAGVDYGIGVNPYRCRAAAWYSLADVVASILLTGKIPTIRRALSLRGVGRQPGMMPVRIRGMVEIDPATEDFFKRVIELRREIEADPSYAVEERERLSEFLKVLASSTSYGILAEFVRRELRDPVEVQVFADGDEPFITKTSTPEDAGPFCFPPLAASITGAARLMLALLERSVTDLSGSYVFCDTDSMGIVADSAGGLHACPGGTHALPNSGQAVRALSWEQVDLIVGRFAALNPYDRRVVAGSILKIEKENFKDG